MKTAIEQLEALEALARKVAKGYEARAKAQYIVAELLALSALRHNGE